MDHRKNANADLERKRGLFFRIGLIVSLGLVMLAFDWKVRYDPNITDEPIIDEDGEYIQQIIVYTKEAEPEPERKIVLTRTLPVEPITFKPVPDNHPIDPEPAVKPAFTIPDRPETLPDPDPAVPLWGADKMPVFGNGYADMESYIRKHIRYPARAVKDGIEGTVFVEFVVDVEGNVKDVRLVHGIRRDLDEEALRVVRSMPRWEPGVNKGFPVPVRQTMPITYKLNRY